MAHSTVTAKGQTTIPGEVRRAVGLRPGDRIHYTVLEDGTIIARVKNRSVRDIAAKPRTTRHLPAEDLSR
jgi:AbrB family looped-hinge helix DNA binding protein